MTPTELYTLGLNLRRATTNRELLDYLDRTMGLLKQDRECPRCAERRRLKTEAMKRYRAKQSGDFE